MYPLARYFNEKLLYRGQYKDNFLLKGGSLLRAMNEFKPILQFLRHFPKALSGLNKKYSIKILMIFAEIEPFTYLCTVKEIMNVELIKKSDEFSVGLIQWLL